MTHQGGACREALPLLRVWRAQGKRRIPHATRDSARTLVLKRLWNEQESVRWGTRHEERQAVCYEALTTPRSEGRAQERPCQWMLHTVHHQEGIIHIVPVGM